MGQQIETDARLDGKRHSGVALLETDYVLFRAAGPKPARAKVAFREIKSLKTKDGWLLIRHAAGSLDLELGPRAEKWAEKIRSPKSRLDKLGAAPGAAVALTGADDAEFRRELAARGCAITEGAPPKDSALIVFGAESRADLSRVKTLSSRLSPAGALWVLYPKGQKHITENDVIAAGRAAGLKDVKVVGFSPTHTALKFVIPVADR
jgi:hypothetical protein